MSGTLTPAGFAHRTYAYKIDSPPGTSAILAEHWRLDSAFVGEQGLTPKESEDYTTTLSFDLNGDGVFDKRRTALIYDLRYVHRVNSGVIWLRTVPISNTLRDKKLRVLMQDYVDDVAGAGYEVVNVGATTEVVEKRYAADIRRRGSGTVGAQESFVADFSVANVDQVHVNKDARRTRVMVVISRPGFEHSVEQESGAVQFPVLFVAGYSSQPEDFDEGLADFQALMERVRFSEHSGYSVEWEPASGAASATEADAAAGHP